MIFKLLVVDDEATMRKGIANYMNWESIDCEVVATASDGSEAIGFLNENHVDIVITDIKMPVLDGLALAKHIYENVPEIKVILLTGYADFEYAKTAIQYKVCAFILKPTNKKDLFEAVQTAQNQIITSKNNNRMEQEEEVFLKNQLLQELTDSQYTPSLAKKMEHYQIILEHYFIAAFQLCPLGNDLSALKTIILDGQQSAYCYRYNNLLITIYIVADADPKTPAFLINHCQEISAIVETLGSQQVAIGISRYHGGADNFSTAVAEAINALSQNFYTENNMASYHAPVNREDYDLTAENSLDLFQLENSLHNLLFDDAYATVHNLFTKFKRRFMNAIDAKNICSQIYYICSRVLIKKGATPPAPEFLTGIYDSTDIFSLESSVHELLNDAQKHLLGAGNHQNKIVADTIQFIHQNLADSLSLENIAEHLHISPSHLSRTFRKAYQESLTDYINKTRIEKAKEYLINSDVLTYEIAGLVGYNDPTYFSSIFKKYTGMSPKEFKNQFHYRGR